MFVIMLLCVLSLVRSFFRFFIFLLYFSLSLAFVCAIFSPLLFLFSSLLLSSRLFSSHLVSSLLVLCVSCLVSCVSMVFYFVYVSLVHSCSLLPCCVVAAGAVHGARSVGTTSVYGAGGNRSWLARPTVEPLSEMRARASQVWDPARQRQLISAAPSALAKYGDRCHEVILRCKTSRDKSAVVEPVTVLLDVHVPIYL